ncbi:hypothetical protein L1987_52975 [Smallanthus sonchifolius]|uniref:Uncharacterized protein n=1 Tax=Smallanthus sonchifolius TaxID=185202 RepID=A0ACB9EUK4_9ASTR|nr:hypothetical protein L1987_52975 [Smallanthus sonchifolius]
MLYGGYKNINQVKKEAFSAYFGLGYQENLQKIYTPKSQSSSGQTIVHQTTYPAHHVESSNARSNEPYRRTYKEKRTCFHCGMVGHILVNSPTKNQGKRPIISQPTVIPKSPLVKHSKSAKENVVKPPVKPMVKPKITSEAKPFVSKRRKLPAKPSASTSGSAQTGEASTSSPAAVESKSTILVKKKKRSWNIKSKCSQSPDPKSSKDSSIFDSHDCNMALLQYVKPFRGSYVAFAGEKGGSITCQGVVSNGCVSFDNVNYCEQLKNNLLSVSQMCDKEYLVMFDKTECLILKPCFEVPEDWILMRAPTTNDTYQIDMSVATTTSSVATCLLNKTTELDSILWHRKLGHISYQKMNNLVRNGLVTGVPKLRFTVADDCMPCKKEKQQRKSHKPKLQNSIDTPFELLHMDLFSPISIRSIGDAKLPVTLWAEAVNKACHVLNRVLVMKRHNKTCYELINNRPPNLDYLVPFGSPCSLLLQYKYRNFDYDALFKSFNLPDLSGNDAYELFGGGDDSSFSTRATVPIVTPDSNAASASGTHDGDNSENVHVDGNDAQANPNTRVGNEAPVNPINIEASSSGTQDMGELSTNLDSEIQEPNVLEMRVHKIHPIDNIIGDPHAGVQTRHRTIAENTSLYSEILDIGVIETCLHAAFVSQLEPKNVKEALADNCWIEAMQEELSQFQKLHVSDLVDLPRGVQPIGTRRVFKCKTDDRHVVVKNKARLVSAIMYGKVHEVVYVTQPPGFEDPHNINKVYKLDKALYGLHQAPRAWYDTLSKHLLSNGFDHGQIDLTLFIRKVGGDILLVQVYVDDIIFGSTNEEMCREFEQVMKSKFEISNMGELSFFLGLQVIQREDGIYLHQTKYVQNILSKYNMNDSSTYGTPIPVNHGLHPDKDGKDVD